MSRSFRHHLIKGAASVASEKYDKKRWHGRFRVKSRALLHAPDDRPLSPREVSDPWGFAKDGKIVWSRRDHREYARDEASYRGRTAAECFALEARYWHRVIAK